VSASRTLNAFPDPEPPVELSAACCAGQTPYEPKVSEREVQRRRLVALLRLHVGVDAERVARDIMRIL